MTIESRICKLYNELTPTYFPHLGNHNSTLIDVQLTSNQPHTFQLHYLISKVYNNPSILYEQILSVTDKFLDEWFDLTEFGDDFRIYIHYTDAYVSTESYTYYELMYKSTNNIRFDPYIPISDDDYNFQRKALSREYHPRYDKYVNWVMSKKETQKRLDLVLNYQEMLYREPKEPETFFGKIKNKFVDLFHV